MSRERVGHWRWQDRTCRDLNELREVLTWPDLAQTVLRLRLELVASLGESREVERILRELEGGDDTHPKAGITLVDRSGLRLRAGGLDGLRGLLPPVLADTFERLERVARDEDLPEGERQLALRAQDHLAKLLQTLDTAEVRR